MDLSKIQKSKIFPSDCLICAIRPCLFLNQFNIYHARFYCPHRNPTVRKAFFKSTEIYKALHLSFILLQIIGIVNNLQQLKQNPTIKRLFLIAESCINGLVVGINVICLLQSHIKIKESHGLITLMRKRRAFGVDEVLGSSPAKKVNFASLLMICVIMVEEMITVSRTIAKENITFAFMLRMISIEILILVMCSLGFYILQFLILYYIMFKLCFQQMKNHLLLIDNSSRRKHEFVEKLRKLQRFYMCLRRNFKLNESFMRFGTIIILTIAVCVLLISYSYLAVLYLEQDLNLLNFDHYIVAKSVLIVLLFCLVCYFAQSITDLNNEMKSVLFKCRISKLNLLECAQMQIIIETLTLQKPDLVASGIFSVGTSLLATVAGTVLTYVLVALQFHALISGKQ